MNRVDKHLFFHNDPFVGFQYSAIAQAGAKKSDPLPGCYHSRFKIRQLKTHVFYIKRHIAFQFVSLRLVIHEADDAGLSPPEYPRQ